MNLHDYQTSNPEGSWPLKHMAHAMAEHPGAEGCEDGDLPLLNIGITWEDDGEFHELVGVEVKHLGTAIHDDHIVWNLSNDSRTLQLCLKPTYRVTLSRKPRVDVEHPREFCVV